jgi:hypothetical protein
VRVNGVDCHTTDGFATVQRRVIALEPGRTNVVVPVRRPERPGDAGPVRPIA